MNRRGRLNQRGHVDQDGRLNQDGRHVWLSETRKDQKSNWLCHPLYENLEMTTRQSFRCWRLWLFLIEISNAGDSQFITLRKQNSPKFLQNVPKTPPIKIIRITPNLPNLPKIIRITFGIDLGRVAQNYPKLPKFPQIAQNCQKLCEIAPKI